MTYALNTFGLCFATIPALFTWLLLEKRQEIAEAMRTSPLLKLFRRNKSEPDVEPVSSSPYGQVSSLWYVVVLLVSLGIGIFACEYYPVQLHWYGVLLAFVVSAVFFIPV